jgi:hypothetical protein
MVIADHRMPMRFSAFAISRHHLDTIEFVRRIRRVVEVMGVEDELELAGIELLNRSLDLRGERRELVVHNQAAVRPDGHADVSTRAFEHVDVFGDGNDFDFDVREVALGNDSCRAKSKRQQKKGSGFHGTKAIQPGTGGNANHSRSGGLARKLKPNPEGVCITGRLGRLPGGQWGPRCPHNADLRWRRGWV